MKYKHGDKIHNAKFLGYQNTKGFTYGRPYTLVVHSTKDSGEPKQVSVVSDDGTSIVLFANLFSWKATEERPSVEDLLLQGKQARQAKLNEALLVFIKNRFLSGTMNTPFGYDPDFYSDADLEIAYEKACQELRGLDNYKLVDTTYLYENSQNQRRTLWKLEKKDDE